LSLWSIGQLVTCTNTVVMKLSVVGLVLDGGNSLDKLRHPRSVAYSAELVAELIQTVTRWL